VEKRLLLAASISLAILVAWEWIAPKPARRPVPAPPVPSPAASPAAAAAPAPTAPPQAEEARPAERAPESASSEAETTISNSVFRATFSNRGAVLKSFVLTGHYEEEGKPLELVRTLPEGLPRPLAVVFGKDEELTRRVSNALFVVEEEAKDHVRFRFADSTIAVTKEIRFHSGYLFDVDVTVDGPPFDLVVGPGLRNPGAEELRSRYVLPASAVAATTQGLKLVRPEKATAASTWPVPARGFAGVEDNYFLEVLVPRAATTARVLTYSAPRQSGKPELEIATGVAGRGKLECSAYFGPKDVSILESYGLGLERTVDFGWYGILARPLLWLMKKVQVYVGNWGLAILVVTFLIRVALFPLMAKSYVSMKKMQKLAPKMNAIRDKYKKSKTDAAQRQKMNAELMALYQAEGYNPMSGCLPMILQLPILVAFYNVLAKTIELRHAPFVLWIKDLSSIDSTYILVILMIVSMYAQQAMTPSTMDPAQKKIFMFMPVLWGFFLKDMPSGLVLYWLFSNVLTIVQQLLMNRLGKDDEAPPTKKPRALKKARA
jgi:YidC/Oxa1 family membrane protein insertase